MTLSIDDIKALVANHHDKFMAIDKRVPVPDAFTMPCYDYDEGEPAQSVADYVRNIRLHDAPLKAVAMHEQLVADLQKFSDIIDAKVKETTEINEKIDLQHTQLNNELQLKLNEIPEVQLNGYITINKKNVDPADFDAFVEIYKALGFTHYLINSYSDFLFYSRSTGHFNTIKQNFMDEMPRSLRKKYPTILNFMQNGLINTHPLCGDDLYKVISAKKN